MIARYRRALPKAAGRPVRVLVCEDVPELRELVAHGLRRQPDLAVVGSAGDAHGATHLAERLDPDVIVVDLEMPGASGDELVLAIRRAAATAGIVVFSGRAEALGPDAEAAVSLRVDKTVPLDELAAGVAEVGRVRRAARGG